MTLQDILVIIAAIFVVLMVLPTVADTITYNRRARKLGCEPPLRLLEPPLGIPAVIKVLQAFVNDEILEYFRSMFDSYKVHTARRMVAGQMWLGTRDPENIKAILATGFKDFSLGFRYQAMYPLLGNGIFTLSGEGWKHSRAMLRPQFARDQVTRLESLRHHINMLLAQFRSPEPVEAQTLFHCLTLDTATEFLFGESADTLVPEKASRGIPAPRGTVTGAQFAESFTHCLEMIAYRIIAGPVYWLVDTPGFRRSVRVCHNFVDYFVLKALEKPMAPDEVSDRYVFIRELTKETHDAQVIRDQAFNILLAGRDTTAALLSFTTVYLAVHKEEWRKVRQAVLEEFGTKDAEGVTFESLKRCKPLQNVLNEVLRLQPIVPLNFRTTIRDTILPRGGGKDESRQVFVPKGTNCFYDVHAMQRDKALWGEDADVFRPDRWNEGRAVGWEYIPFNGGPRICLGQQFALTEASYTIVRMCQEFRDIELLHPDPVSDPSFTKMWMRLTISVAGGVKARFIPA